MAVNLHGQQLTPEVLDVAERLRVILSQWVRTTRDQTGTPSSAKIETLRLLQNEGSATIAALAQRRAVKHQSMRLVIEQLALEGTVRKNTDPVDRRNQIVSITKSGRSTLKEEQRLRVEWIAQLLHGRGSKEVNQVIVALNTLEKLLDSSITASV